MTDQSARPVSLLDRPALGVIGRLPFLRAELGAGSLASMSGSFPSAVRAQSGPGCKTIETALRRSVQLARDSGISGVPSIVINGKSRTGASLAGGNQGIITVIDTLTEQDHSAT